MVHDGVGGRGGRHLFSRCTRTSPLSVRLLWQYSAEFSFSDPTCHCCPLFQGSFGWKYKFWLLCGFYLWKKSHKTWVWLTNLARYGLHTDIIYTFPPSSHCFSWIFEFPAQLACWSFIIATACLVMCTHFSETSKGFIVCPEEQAQSLHTSCEWIFMVISAHSNFFCKAWKSINIEKFQNIFWRPPLPPLPQGRFYSN